MQIYKDRNNVKLSIIVPVYNVEKYIDRCMESLLHQSLKEIQIILVDDGSPDTCGNICDRYGEIDRRVVVIHKSNEGLGFARNTGIQYAEGEYVAIFSGFSIVKQNRKIINHPEVKQVEFYCSKKERENYLLGMIGAEPDYPKDAHFTMSVWRGIYKRELINNGNCRFPSERNVVSEDIIFHIQFMYYARRIAIIPECYYFYCENESSLTHTYRADRFEKVLNLLSLIDELLIKYSFTDKDGLCKDRLLLARARGAIRQICQCTKSLVIKEANNELRKILSSPQLRHCIYEYEWRKLPYAQKLFFLMMKVKSVTGVRLLIYMNDLKKRSEEN